MNILINFSTLKKGGGQNVGLNFLSSFEELSQKEDNFYFFVAEGSSIHHFLLENRNKCFYTTPNNPFYRILFEFFLSWWILRKLKIDIIYSYFGIGFFPKKYKQVIGSADSNLYFPEVKFWNGYSGFSLLKKKLIDKYRIWGLYRADGIVYENSLLEERCHIIFKVKAKTTTILPSISNNFKKDEFSFPSFIQENTKKGLFLCSWQLNKGITIIPELAFYLKQMNIDFHFLLTAPQDNSTFHRLFSDELKKFKVEDMVSIIGPIKKENLESLYSKIDIVFLLSKLESFSNNIIESWTYKKVLVAADEPWARAVCKEGAIYVDRENAEDIASKVCSLLSNSIMYSSVVSNGIMNLIQYPTISEKVNSELEFLKIVYESN